MAEENYVRYFGIDRANYFKQEAGWARLREIVKKYEPHIKGKVDYEGTLADYPTHGKIEFPLQLLKDIHEKGDFVDTICNREYPALKRHGLPKNFDLSELIGYFGDDGEMKEFNQWYVDKIKNVKIKRQKVYLDVLVRDVTERHS